LAFELYYIAFGGEFDKSPLLKDYFQVFSIFKLFLSTTLSYSPNLFMMDAAPEKFFNCFFFVKSSSDAFLTSREWLKIPFLLKGL
jgi:hypothetical protein